MDLQPNNLSRNLFNAYEEDFHKHLHELERIVTGLVASDASGIAEAERYATLADEALKHLEMEVRTLAASEKNVLRPKVKLKKDMLNSVKRELKDLSEEADKLGLLGGRREGQQKYDKEMNTLDEQMERGERILRGAQDEALQAETVGHEIMGDLYRQREMINRTKGNLGALGSELDTSNQTLDDIMGVYKKNRTVANMVCAMIVLAVLVVIFIRMRSLWLAHELEKGWHFHSRFKNATQKQPSCACDSFTKKKKKWAAGDSCSENIAALEDWSRVAHFYINSNET